MDEWFFGIENWSAYPKPLQGTFYYDIRSCTICALRDIIKIHTFVVEETQQRHDAQVVCEPCRQRSFIRENCVKTNVVSDDQVQHVLRLGPSKVQVDKKTAVTKSNAPKELTWSANTQIEVIFFFKDGTTVGATKQLALFAYINDAPFIVGVLDRSKGLDVLIPTSWYKLFNLENEALMTQLTREMSLDDEDDYEDEAE